MTVRKLRKLRKPRKPRKPVQLSVRRRLLAKALPSLHPADAAPPADEAHAPGHRHLPPPPRSETPHETPRPDRTVIRGYPGRFGS